MSQTAEESLYEPVRQELERILVQHGSSSLEVTAKGISERIKKRLDDHSLYFLRVEKMLPDIMGEFSPQDSSKVPYYLRLGGTVIAEIKREPPTLKDIFQTKMYAEAFDARLAFIVSEQGLSEEMKRFLKHRSLILYYYGTNWKIWLCQFDRRGGTIIPDSWFPESPLKE